MAKLKKIKTFDCKDVVLLPKECIVNSRSEVSTARQLDTNRDFFDLPIIPANMSTVIDENLSISLAKKNYFYIMHRFDVDAVNFVDRCENENVFSSISLGIKQADYQILENLKNAGKTPDYVTIDVAHGFNFNVVNIAKKVKEFFPTCFVIAGNVADLEGALFLENSGVVDAVKVGIGGGSACLSTPNTGFGSKGWQLSSIEEIAYNVKHVSIIADGGVKEYGDIAKYLAFGADFVMLGGLLAGHDESPGKLVSNEKGEQVKEFFGSASEFQKGHKKNVEGKKLYLPPKGSIFNTYEIIKENLQSAVSYAGGKDLNSLQNVEYVVI